MVPKPILGCSCNALETLEGEILRRLAISFMVVGLARVYMLWVKIGNIGQHSIAQKLTKGKQKVKRLKLSVM